MVGTVDTSMNFWDWVGIWVPKLHEVPGLTPKGGSRSEEGVDSRRCQGARGNDEGLVG